MVGVSKGGGSTYGGKWRPNPDKPEDARYLGEPGEVKTTVMRNGDLYRTKIGPDGRAIRERHETNHHRPDKHSIPHDHEIRWDNPDEHPVPGSPINYEGDAPEFKSLGGYYMGEIIYASSESMRFTSISDFKQSMRWGCEAEFEWKGVLYGVIRYGTDNKITIYVANRPETEKVCETADDALEYMVGEDRLRDVITKVTVLSRTI